MSFDSAVQALVHIHNAELNELRQQISELYISGKNHGAAHGTDGEFLVKSELHHYPLIPTLKLSTPKQCPPSPPFAPRSVCSNACTPTESTFQPSMTKYTSPCASEIQLHALTPKTEYSIVFPKQSISDDNADTIEETLPVLDQHEDRSESLAERWMTLAERLLEQSFVCFVRAGWQQHQHLIAASPALQAQTKEIFMKNTTMMQWGVGRRRWHRSRAGIWVEPFPSYSVNRWVPVAHPGSARCCMWAFLSMLVIVYEVLAITLAPFNVFSRNTRDKLELISAAFWIADVIMNFFTGVYIHGKLELRLRSIAKSYVRTWFAFDFAIAFMQVLALFFVAGDASASGVLLKLVRVVRSLRLGRMTSWTQKVVSKVLSRRSSLLGAKLMQCLLALYVFVHVNACVWYEIGKGENGWVSGYDKLGDSAAEKYLVAMHWSLSQLQGNIDIHPGRSIHDRLYIVLSSFASIIFLASLVSIMTDALFTAQREMKALLNERRMLERFFHRHQVKPILRQRAEYYLKLRQRAYSSIGHEDQDRHALQMFPLQLRLRLLTESRASTLNWHPVFRYLQNFHWSLFVNVCVDALLWQACEPADDIFTRGGPSKGAYYISSGDCVFNARLDCFAVLKPWLEDAFVPQGQSGAGNAFSDSIGIGARGFSAQSCDSVESKSIHVTYQDFVSHDKNPVSRLREGSFVSEVSLWAMWVHAGDMVAMEHCQCYSLGWSELLTLVAQHPEAQCLLAFYAERFVNALVLVLKREAQSHAKFFELMGFTDVMRIENEISESTTQG